MEEDLRNHERVLVPEACRICVKANGKGPQLEGTVSVIGLRGMFVRTKSPPAAGSTLHVVLTGANVSLESECKVVHVKPNGMGVELNGLTPENEEKLKALLLELKS
jgi:hypothetical protein